MAYTTGLLLKQLQSMVDRYGPDLPVFVERETDPEYPIELDEASFVRIEDVVHGIGKDIGWDPYTQQPNAVLIGPKYVID